MIRPHNRSMSRDLWKALFRVERIVLRHTEQSFHDVILYGTGVVDSGAIQREIAGERPKPKVHPWDVKIEKVRLTSP